MCVCFVTVLLQAHSWLTCQAACQGLDEDEAATRIQAAVRGLLSRKRHSNTQEEDELLFLGMVPKVGAALPLWAHSCTV